MASFTKLHNIAVDMALNTGRFLRRQFYKEKRIEYKGPVDLVTDSDKKAELRIVEGIRRHFPNHNILAEEFTHSSKRSSPYLWIIDPLDGTTNFAHSYPLFAVSIAVQYKGKTVVAVAYQPLLRELFTAIKGKGAYLNGKRIYVSQTGDISGALLATGFPYDIREDPEEPLSHFCNFQKICQDIRRDGSAVLNLCYTACGRYDGFWEMKLKPWDTAAGTLILEEAGGKVTDFRGRRYNIYKPQILATNGRIHLQMLEILNQKTISGQHTN